MVKSRKQKMNFYSFNLNKNKGGRMSLKKLMNACFNSISLGRRQCHLTHPLKIFLENGLADYPGKKQLTSLKQVGKTSFDHEINCPMDYQIVV